MEKKKMMILFLPLLLAAISIHFLDDYVKVGNELEARVNVYNNNPYDIDDVRIRLHIFGLTTLQSSSFDVDDYENYGIWFHYQIPENTRKGLYLAKITAENDDFRDVEPVTLQDLDLTLVDLRRLLRDIDASRLYRQHYPTIFLEEDFSVV